MSFNRNESLKFKTGKFFLNRILNFTIDTANSSMLKCSMGKILCQFLVDFSMLPTYEKLFFSFRIHANYRTVFLQTDIINPWHIAGDKIIHVSMYLQKIKKKKRNKISNFKKYSKIDLDPNWK